MRLVLASASPARLATLRSAGIEPEVIVSDVDEEAALTTAERTRGRDLTVAEQVAILARTKCEAVAATLPAPPQPTLVLGCDSLLELDGQAQGKPWRPEVARQRWRAMRGRSGVLHTGHHLLLVGTTAQPASAVDGVSATVVHFAEVTDAEIDAYVATGEPLAVAGAFTIDGLGGAFVTRIEGDHHGVVGLSLPVLRTLVRALGVDYPSLWTASP